MVYQSDRLENLSKTATKDVVKDDFMKLNLYEIYNNTFINMINIFTDLSKYKGSDSIKDTIKGIFNILSKNDRPIYFGIFLITISLLIHFMEATN
tara:strand:+ start:217 stop:501 length:285 start_codon:yes stop_codon:yes gene_type:complete